VATLAKEFPNLVHHIRHQERLGSGSRNYQVLIEQARGELIAHLDGDDFWMPGKLAAQVRFMRDNPECPAVYGNAMAMDDNGSLIGSFNNRLPERFDLNALVRRGNFLCQSSIVYRASVRGDLLALPAPVLDFQMHLLYARHGAVGYLNRVVVAYRANSSTSILASANDRTRRLYWATLLAAASYGVRPLDLARGMAEFARSVFFRSIRMRDISLICEWLPVVLRASTVGKLTMSLLIVAAILRTGGGALLATASALMGRSGLKILYPR
jgi:hypothetical protein